MTTSAEKVAWTMRPQDTGTPVPRLVRAIRLLMIGGSAIFAAAVAIGVALLALGQLASQLSAVLGCLACAGAAMFHLGLAFACIRELRQT